MFGAVRTPRVYEHIVSQIERAIYEGRLAQGNKLPPERQLVREFGASKTLISGLMRTATTGRTNFCLTASIRCCG